MFNSKMICGQGDHLDLAVTVLCITHWALLSRLWKKMEDNKRT